MGSKKILFLSARFSEEYPMVLRWKNYYHSRQINFVYNKIEWNFYTNKKIIKLILVLKIFSVVRSKGIDFIHVNDLESGMLGKYLYGLFGIKYIYSAHEIFSQESPEDTVGSHSRIVKTSVENEVMSNASMVFVPNKQRISFLENLYPNIDPGKFILAENKALEEINIPLEERFSSSINNNLFSVFYGGTFWHARKQEEFPLLAETLHKNGCEFILSGSSNEYLSTLLGQTDKFNYLGDIPPTQFQEVIKKMDLCLAWYYPTTVNDELCAPLKIFDYLLAGKPVVAPRLPYIEALELQFPKCIILFDTGDMEDCLEKIMQVRNNYNEYLRAVEDLDKNKLSWHSQYEFFDSTFKEQNLL